MNFQEFKSSAPARELFGKLGLTEYLEVAENWGMLRTLIIKFNNPWEGKFVQAVRRCDDTASSGERVLLRAVCYATDFAWLADELSEGKAWQKMDSADGDWRRAVAACIAAE